MKKSTYTTSGLLIIINYYYQHLMGKRKMKQTEGEFGFMIELRAPNLFKLFHKEGNLGLGTQTCTSSSSFLREDQEQNPSLLIPLSEARRCSWIVFPETRLPGGEYHCHGNWWQTASKQATTQLWRSVTPVHSHSIVLPPKSP